MQNILHACYSVSLKSSLFIFFQNQVVTDTYFAYSNYESEDIIVDEGNVRKREKVNWEEKN